jgi:CBS domain-containing protein
MLVHQILRAKTAMPGRDGVVTISPEKTLAEAATMLSEMRIGAVIVSRDGSKPDGILSERDIVREVGRRGIGCMSDAVRDAMTRDVVACAPEDKADAVLVKMTNGRFRHMPVMEGDAMVGVISIGDVVKARLDELSMEKEALEGMIMGY